MRLEASEIANIKQSINQFLSQDHYALYLFGSRADPSKKGGDIDLLLVLKDKTSPTKSAVLSIKHKILAEIKSAIGDQKIDLVVAKEHELTIDPFLITIKKTAIKL
jgi:predicted nucleotidyltransferase